MRERHGFRKYVELKPCFSSITLIGLYVLLYLIFACKAKLVIAHYMDIVLLAPIAALFYGIIMFLLLVFNRKVLGLEYGHHQAVVFTTASKNIALTIAILVSVFGKTGQFMAVYPAIMAVFQAPVLIMYLRYSDKIKILFKTVKKEAFST